MLTAWGKGVFHDALFGIIVGMWGSVFIAVIHPILMPIPMVAAFVWLRRLRQREAE